MDTTSVKVDISLLVYNNIAEMFEETMMLVTDLPNSGSASVLLSESFNSSLPQSDYNLHTTIVKVAVNTSTTSLVRSKRSTSVSTVTKILNKIKQFGKPLMVFAVKYSVVSRILCEAWVAVTPRFPTRSIPPCPCNETSADGDNRFIKDKDAGITRRYIFHYKSKSCYRQANVRQVKSIIIMR